MTEQRAQLSGELRGELRSIRERSGKVRLGLALVSTAVLAAVLGSRLSLGDSPGFAAASLAGYLYWLGVGGGAAILLAVLRLSRAEWRRPLARPAEFLSLLVLLALALYRYAVSWRGTLVAENAGRATHSLWPWEHGNVGWMLDLAVAAPMVVLVGLLFSFGTRADLSGQGRPTSPGRLRVWSCFEIVSVMVGLVVLGWGFGMTQIPGWETTLFGPYFVITSLLHGTAAVAVLAIGLTWALGLEEWVTPHHLGQLSKLLIGLVLIWFYVQFAELITVWYGHIPREMSVLRMRTLEAHPGVFALVVVSTFPIPLLYFSFPGLRRRVAGVFAVCCLILIAGLGEWALLFASASQLDMPAGLLPMLLLPAAFGLVLAGVSSFVPPLSVWEIEEGIRARDSVGIGERRIATYALVDLPEGASDDRQE